MEASLSSGLATDSARHLHNGLPVSYFESIPEAKGMLFRKRIYKHQIMLRYRFSKYPGVIFCIGLE